jgi:hypothetical protein
MLPLLMAFPARAGLIKYSSMMRIVEIVPG